MSEFSSDCLEEILSKLHNVNEKDIANLINKYIDLAMKESKNNNYDIKTLGCESEINPTNYHIADKSDIDHILIDGVSFWIGFIPEDVKVVYGWNVDKNFVLSNQGCYYYINDKNYLYNFAKFIKDKKISNDSDLIFLVYSYIKDYFYSFNKIDRDELHRLIYKNDKLFYKPTNEHSILDFKEKGAAKCTEYSALLQNILSTFGYSIIYLTGSLIGEDNHAFNIAIIDNEYHLIDFSIPVNCFDINCNFIKKIPYMYELKDFTNEDLDEMIYSNKVLELDDFECHLINGNYYNFPKVKKRKYKVENMEI